MSNDPRQPDHTPSAANTGPAEFDQATAAGIRRLAQSPISSPRLPEARQAAMLAAAGAAISARAAAAERSRHRRGMPWLRIGPGLAAAAAIALVVWAGLAPLMQPTPAPSPLASGTGAVQSDPKYGQPAGEGGRSTAASGDLALPPAPPASPGLATRARPTGTASAKTRGAAAADHIATGGPNAGSGAPDMQLSAAQTRTPDAVDALVLARAIASGTPGSGGLPDTSGGTTSWDIDGDGQIDSRDVDAILTKAVRISPTIGAIENFYRGLGVPLPRVFAPFQPLASNGSPC